MDSDDRLKCIEHYFNAGLKYRDIVLILFQRHNISLSVRHLIRILHRRGFYRRKRDQHIVEAFSFIVEQQKSSGSLHGYRWMHEKCKRFGINVNKEDVRCLISLVNPEGVALRQRHRLRRRTYHSKGPNYIWHMDSYDKLRPYGICINGCIDGYSRKIVWLNAYHTSSDPSLIGSYYLEMVEELGGTPRVVRADMGTENGEVCELQRYLRDDDVDDFRGDKSFLYGKSICNQRIECWWGMLRKECTDYWMNLFKNIGINGDFDGSFLDRHLMALCFLHVIQKELDSTSNVWNNHLIRPSRTETSPHGRPNNLYTIPELYESRDYLCPKNDDLIGSCKEVVSGRLPVPCDEDVYNWCLEYMAEHDLCLEADTDLSINLYRTLRRAIHQIM